MPRLPEVSGRRIRVMVVVPNLRAGGSERVITTLLSHFDRRSFELSLVVCDLGGAMFLASLPADVEIIDLSSARVRYALWKILGTIRVRRPDVVLTTLGHLNVTLALLKPLIPKGVRLIARESTIVSQGLGEFRPLWLWRRMFAIAYRNVDRLVCQSRAMRDDAVEFLGVDPRRTVVIHNPVDIEAVRRSSQLRTGEATTAWRVRSGSFELIAVGRLSIEKGFDLLLRALARCEGLDVRLTIIGEGPLESELKALCAELRVEDRVTFLGLVTNPFPYIANADALVLSSRYEGLPNVVLEALACGTPVIATPAIGGTREVLENAAGCELLPEVSVDALESAIRKWSAERPRRLPADAADRFSVQRIVGAYAEIIVEVAHGD